MVTAAPSANTLTAAEVAQVAALADTLASVPFRRIFDPASPVHRYLYPLVDLAEDEYRVRADKLPAVYDAVAKLARRAERLGVALPSFEVVREETVPEVALLDDAWTFTGALYVASVLRPTTHSIVLSGWQFVATIEHLGEAGNVLRTTPAWTQPLPTAFRTDGPTCEHCRMRRARLETFVVHDGTTYRRVGRNCLADFLGDATAAQVIAAAALDRAMLSALVDDESEGFGRSGEMYASPLVFCAAVACVISKVGWLSRGAARQMEGKRATTSLAWSALFAVKPNEVEMEIRTALRDPEQYAVHAATATAALTWAKAIHPDVENDYLYNARTCAHLNAWDYRKTGIGGSIVASYLREQQKLVRMQFERQHPSTALTEPVGYRFGAPAKNKKTPGTPRLVARVLGIISLAGGQFGPTTIVRMQTPAVEVDGAPQVHDLVWFAAGSEIQVVLDAAAIHECAVAMRASEAAAQATWGSYALPEAEREALRARADALGEIAAEARVRASQAHRDVAVGDLVEITGTIKKVQPNRKTARIETVMQRCTLRIAVDVDAQ